MKNKKNLEKVIDLLQEQSTLQFSGRVNILDGDTSKLEGYLLIFEGELFSAKYKNVAGKKAFVKFLFDADELQSYRMVLEPEVINPEERNISCGLSELIEKSKTEIVRINKYKHLRPKNHLKLMINADFILQGEELSHLEYGLLCVLSDYNKVEDIYRECDFFENDITLGLISLRKKNALIVLSSD